MDNVLFAVVLGVIGGALFGWLISNKMKAQESKADVPTIINSEPFVIFLSSIILIIVFFGISPILFEGWSLWWVTALFLFVGWLTNTIVGSRIYHKTDKPKHHKASSHTTAPSHNKIGNVDDEITVYSEVLLHLSASGAEEVRKTHNGTEAQSTTVMVQLIGFCIINLIREFNSEGISTDKGQDIIKSILKNVSDNLAPTHQQSEAFDVLRREVGQLVKDYGKLPLKHTNSDRQGGTLLWEYGKLVAETVGKESDLMATMDSVGVITSVSKAVNTGRLTKTLQ